MRNISGGHVFLDRKFGIIDRIFSISETPENCMVIKTIAIFGMLSIYGCKTPKNQSDVLAETNSTPGKESLGPYPYSGTCTPDNMTCAYFAPTDLPVLAVRDAFLSAKKSPANGETIYLKPGKWQLRIHATFRSIQSPDGLVSMYVKPDSESGQIVGKKFGKEPKLNPSNGEYFDGLLYLNPYGSVAE